MALKIDKSLAEVLEWREQLRQECESMSTEKQIAYIHQEAQKIMQLSDLNLVTMDSRTRKMNESFQN
ncbi:hypothetical protein BGP_5739 [Beggiatoa sp. PS]|nr:hypothetical protein BGP_5739 [Beggiatoa sp. PS]